MIGKSTVLKKIDQMPGKHKPVGLAFARNRHQNQEDLIIAKAGCTIYQSELGSFTLTSSLVTNNIGSYGQVVCAFLIECYMSVTDHVLGAMT